MIYTVDCSFADPDGEAEWNDFYSRDKLPALISVAGFRTSQRLEALTPGCPTYLAIHTVDGLDVLTSEAYRRKGGGSFAQWQPHITDWHRNLYDGQDRAPAVAEDEVLALCHTGPAPLVRLGLAPVGIHAVALDKCPVDRWLATLSRHRAQDIGRNHAGVFLYAPMTAQLTSAGPAAGA